MKECAPQEIKKDVVNRNQKNTRVKNESSLGIDLRKVRNMFLLHQKILP